MSGIDINKIDTNRIVKGGQGFVGYEYKEVMASHENVSMLLDCYQNFGWIQDENMAPAGSRGNTILKMKRDRRIINKTELTRLQRNFEGSVEELIALKKAGTSAANITALVIGLIGTVFMAGSTFAVTAEPPHILLCIILAVPGFLGWILPYFAYRMVIRRKVKQLTPLIEAKYEEIYTICEKGNHLLY